MNITIHGHSIESITQRLEQFRDAIEGARPITPIPCPGYRGETCVEELVWEHATPADPDTGTDVWHGGWRCVCGFSYQNEPPERKYR